MRKYAFYLVMMLVLAAALVAAIHQIMPGWYARFWYPLSYGDLIVKHARQNELEPALVAAVIYEESSFDSRSQSRAGAVGLMQLMPLTAAWIAEKNDQALNLAELNDPELNIALGCWYLRYLLDRYDGSQAVALAAYNGGTENVDRWLAAAQESGREFSPALDIPYRETRSYVTEVFASRQIYSKAYGQDLGG